MPSTICVSMAQAVPPDVDFAEIRLDMMDVTIDQIADLFSVSLPIIATCRPGRYGDDTRKSFLLKAIESGAAYVDIEVDAPYREEIVDAARHRACSVIVSYHNEMITPDRNTLEQLVSLCRAAGADIVKIACKIRSSDDSERLLALFVPGEKMVIVGLGKLGVMTRVAALKRGGMFTYVALDAEQQMAEGQPDMKTMRMYMKRRLAVAGKPILHSRSPEIFSGECSYTRIATDDPSELLAFIRAADFDGCNITAPLKQKIMHYLDSIDPSAEAIGAVNTVVLDSEGALRGYNTDSVGVFDTLQKIEIVSKKCVVLGAGGAAAAAAYALKSMGADVLIVNRTGQKSALLAQQLGCRSAPFHCIADELVDSSLLISCISSRDLVIPSESLHKDLIVFDASYTFSSLMEEAKKRGCTVIDGREWLLGQARQSYELFFGKKAPSLSLKESSSRRKKGIAFVGFMGAGKTATAHALAKKMNIFSVDVDGMIEETEGMAIADLFSFYGEKRFRALENKCLRECCEKKYPLISCGGGMPLDENNRALLREHYEVVWLWASPQEIISRIGRDATRPLFNADSLDAMIADRTPYYASIADLVVITDNKTPQHVADKVFDEINRTF